MENWNWNDLETGGYSTCWYICVCIYIYIIIYIYIVIHRWIDGTWCKHTWRFERLRLFGETSEAKVHKLTSWSGAWCCFLFVFCLCSFCPKGSCGWVWKRLRQIPGLENTELALFQKACPGWNLSAFTLTSPGFCSGHFSRRLWVWPCWNSNIF